jgi:hypothetical protein
MHDGAACMRGIPGGQLQMKRFTRQILAHRIHAQVPHHTRHTPQMAMCTAWCIKMASDPQFEEDSTVVLEFDD